MYRDANDGRDAKIAEKTEKARKDFWDKCEKIKRSGGYNHKLIQETANHAADEYNKVFGRLGVHPLLHIKGGKKRPRYIVDRDETWVLYKPALWAMGGIEKEWKKKLDEINKKYKKSNQEEAYMAQEKLILQEWHGLLTGTHWLPQDPTKELRGWGFIQRLDLETDGPVMVAKTWRAFRSLQVQMREHVNTKAYMCLVHGRMENKTKYIKRKFAELGSDTTTQVMLQFDAFNDPFFDWSTAGKWKQRNVRMAETFFKPLAYYHRKEDNTDYTLVYVNILTGITHQIRITMQSEGHPLVSDDRYLPKDQAMADLKWCPRNFLIEVRADFFDVTGPHEDEPRRRYTRVCIENPLPKVFQNILDSKLTLVEKLDESADLFVGPRYWAIGDEELMSAYPKDTEYRRKVIRWGTRRGIHLDALDRLLLLSKDDIDEVLNNYQPPNEMGADRDSTWICPKCMYWNSPARADKVRNRADYDPEVCAGGNKEEPCKGTRQVEPGYQLPHGWLNYAKDPTIHLLYTVNGKWLNARRAVLAKSRHTWDRAIPEPDGTEANANIIGVLTMLLELKVKAGEVGIHEQDLPKFAGLENVKLPIGGFPPDCPVQRVRLPGRGTGSQWTYTLKASQRIEWSAEYDKRPRFLTGPLAVKTDVLPEKQVKKPEPKAPEGQRSQWSRALVTAGPADPAIALDEAVAEPPPRPAAAAPEPAPAAPSAVANGAREAEAVAERERAAGRVREAAAEEPPAKRARKWERRESTSNPGAFYYVDVATGETSVERPADYEPPATLGPPGKEVVWERLVSKTTGKSYFYNHKTGESRVDQPTGVEIKGLDASKGTEEVRWERRESASKPGHFYYFNSKTGENEVHPPRVDLPWALMESKTKRGQWFYYNEVTGVTLVDPPSCARAASGPPPTNGHASKAGGDSVKATTTTPSKDKLPSNWVKKESEKFKGKYYYTNTKTGETSWIKPSPWEKCESKTHPGKYYYQNAETGETSWEKQVVGVVDK